MAHKSWAHHSFSVRDTPEARAAYVLEQAQAAERYDRMSALESMRSAAARLKIVRIYSDWLPGERAASFTDGYMAAEDYRSLEHFDAHAYAHWVVSRPA